MPGGAIKPGAGLFRSLGDKSPICMFAHVLLSFAHAPAYIYVRSINRQDSQDSLADVKRNVRAVQRHESSFETHLGRYIVL